MKLKDLKGVLTHDKPIRIYTFIGNQYKDLFIGKIVSLQDDNLLEKEVDAIFISTLEVSILLV